MAQVKAAAKGKARPAKSKPPTKTVEDYLASAPESTRGMFYQLRAAVRSAVPREATEIISYQIPAFKHGRVLVWFAAFSGHCSLFPTAEIITMFRDELENYPTSKGTIQFPAGQRLPTALIKRIVKARVQKARG